MISINLLPEQNRARVANVEKEMILFALLIVLLIMIFFLTQQWIERQVHSARNLQEQKTKQKQELLKKIGEINQLEKKTTELEHYIQAIKSIRKQQSRPVRFLDELVTHLPQNKIWFESLSLQKDRFVDVRGVALDNQVFATYIKSIRQSAIIQDVNLHQTSRKKIGEYNLVAYQCRVKSGFEQLDRGSDGQKSPH